MTCEVHGRLQSEKPIAFTGAGRLSRIEGAAGPKFTSTTAWECSFINLGSVGTFTEVRTLFSSYRPCKRGPIPRLDGLWAKLFTILTCCLAVVSVSGCGSAAGSSTTGTTNTGTAGTGTAASVALSALSCSNASMTGAGNDTCTVTLSSAAGSGGRECGPGQQQCGGHGSCHGGGCGQCDQRRLYGYSVVGYRGAIGNPDGECGWCFQDVRSAAECCRYDGTHVNH